MEELLKYFESEKEKFGYFRINLIEGQRCFDLVWRFPMWDHSHGAFGQNEPRHLEGSPEIGLRWDWRDPGHLFQTKGPLLTCGLVRLNWNPEARLDPEDLFIFQQPANSWLYVNTANLREGMKDVAVDPNLIKGLRDGTTRGKQIWATFDAGCYFLGIDPYADAKSC
jgi:hypothetical protein